MSATDLNKAALRGDDDVIIQCFRNGGNLNISDAQGCTPLITAAMFGRTHVVQTLLDCGATGSSSGAVNIEAKDMWGNTALMRAAQEGRSNSVAVLLERGANPHAQDHSERRTPLMYAAMRGHRDVVVQLLRYGSDVTLTDRQGRDAHALAKKHKHRRLAEILKSHKFIGFSGELTLNTNQYKIDHSEDNVNNTDYCTSMESINSEASSSISSDIAMIPIPSSTPETDVTTNIRNEFEPDITANVRNEFKPDITPNVRNEITELRQRVDYLEEKVTVLSDNIEDQNEILREVVSSAQGGFGGKTIGSRSTSMEEAANEGLLNDLVLYQLSENIGNEWNALGSILGFSRAKLEQFRMDNPHSLLSTVLIMLQTWRDAQIHDERESIKVLIGAFEKIHRRDLTELLTSLTGHGK